MGRKRPDGPPLHRRSRRSDGWDVGAVTLAALLMLGVHHTASAVLDTQLGVDEVRLVTIGLAMALVLLVGVLIARDRPPASQLPRRLTAVWTDPPGDWVAAVLGVVVAIPLLGLLTPVLLRDADSARIVAAVTHVQSHGIGFLLDTQDNFMPHLVLGPAVAIGGLPAVKVVTLFSVQALAGVTAYVTRKITGSMAGAGVAAIAVIALPPVVDRSGYVPMYPTMLGLGYLGGWLAHQAMTRPDRPWGRAGAAGVCLALAPEAQPVGQLFLVAPLLLLLFAEPPRRGLAGCARIYVTVGIAMLPRLVVNLWVDGFDRITSYRTDYWINQGYVRLIQSEYAGYLGVDEPLPEYLSLLPGRFVSTLEPQGAVVLGLAVATWLLFCRTRARLFVLGVVAFMVFAVSIKQVPPFPRYYSPLWPGIAILVGVGAAGLVRQRHHLTTAVAVVLAVVLAGLAGSGLSDVARVQDQRRAAVDDGPYRALAAIVQDVDSQGDGVIGARSHALVNVTADIPTWGGQFLTEDEYVTYLTWPSDEAVIEVMERRDIGWVLIHPNRLLETRYHNTWLVPHHGLETQHIENIVVSPNFCRTAELGGYVLFRLGPCDQAG